MSSAKAWWLRWSPEHRAPFEYHGHWWQSATGSYADGSNKPVYVAAVMALSEDDAKRVIAAAYDEPTALEWSFVQSLGDGGPFSERFPRAEWMKWPYPELVRRLSPAEVAVREWLWENREDAFAALAERPRPEIIAKMVETIGSGEERTAYGAPLDLEEAALLRALRSRGLNELAEMALHCFGDGYGRAPAALAELEALFVAVRKPRIPNQLTDEVKKLDPGFAAAMARVFELAPEFTDELDQRPVLLSRDNRQMTHVVSLQSLEKWFLAHGVRCRLAIEADAPSGHRLVFLEAELASK